MNSLDPTLICKLSLKTAEKISIRETSIKAQKQKCIFMMKAICRSLRIKFRCFHKTTKQSKQLKVTTLWFIIKIIRILLILIRIRMIYSSKINRWRKNNPKIIKIWVIFNMQVLIYLKIRIIQFSLINNLLKQVRIWPATKPAPQISKKCQRS